MKCATSQKLIKKYYTTLEKLSSNECYQKHIHTCPACQAQLKEEREINQLLHSLPQLSPSTNLQSNIWQEISSRQSKALSGKPYPLIPKLMGSMAALVVIVLGISTLLLDHDPQPKVTLADYSSSMVISKLAEQASGVRDKKITLMQEKEKLIHDKSVTHDEQIKMSKMGKTKAVIETQPIEPPTVNQTGRRPHRVDNQSRVSRIKQLSRSSRSMSQKSKHDNQAKSDQPIVSSSGQAFDSLPGPLTGPAQGFKLYKNKINVNQGESTRITLSLDQSAKVTITIYSRLGRLVNTVVDEQLARGQYEWTWDGKNQSNQVVGTGIYLLLYKVNDQQPEKFKIIVIK